MVRRGHRGPEAGYSRRLAGTQALSVRRGDSISFYTADGQELARSQLANSRASLPGTGVYDWHLWLDPVLSSEEQLELAQQLQKDPELSRFFGTVGNLVSEEETDERWCDVVGVADEERQVLYPKTITYVYADQEITLVDTDSSFLTGKS